MARTQQELTDPRVQGQHRPRGVTTELDRQTEAEVITSFVPARRSKAKTASTDDRAELRAAAEALVRRCRMEQGLPPKISDPGLVAKIVALVRPTIED